VRCACLVYAVGHRSPLVLASAAATVDHLSGGRAVLGLGAGYVAREHEAHGRALLAAVDRSVHLEEVVRAARRLLDGEEVTVDGEHVRLDRARCAPVPVQTHLPIVVGGGGERRTIPLAARVADGWNVPMATPADAARKIAVLREHEAAAGRASGTVEAILNVGLCRVTDQLPARFGARWEVLRPAVLTGSAQQVLDHAAEYVTAGADRLVVSVRAPLDAAVADEVAWFASDIAPELR
jgi:alkanesulfonate monooxygenase SsuD/methylene tetrahydromethanopterin reductase-like flavin-dependent oxidoreductase (luciferase family)